MKSELNTHRMKNLSLKIALKLFAIIDILFAEKWQLTTYKNKRLQATTKYDNKEFKSENRNNLLPRRP